MQPGDASNSRRYVRAWWQALPVHALCSVLAAHIKHRTTPRGAAVAVAAVLVLRVSPVVQNKHCRKLVRTLKYQYQHVRTVLLLEQQQYEYIHTTGTLYLVPAIHTYVMGKCT